MKIALVEPSLASKKNVIRDVIYGCWCGGKRIGGATVPPFELLTLATILKHDGHDVIFVDAQAEQISVAEVARRIAGAELAICSTSVMTANTDAAYLGYLKEQNPGLMTAVYGSHPTFQPEATLEKGIDFALQREPEYVVRDLAAALSREDMAQARATKGVVCKDDIGNVIKNPRYPYIDDLDEIPALDLSFLPNVIYFNPIVRNIPYVTVSTSHGCPAKCNYCTAPFFHGTRTRFQSAKKVLDDIGNYLGQGVREIYYRDETFTADRQRVIDICNGIIERGYKFTWICNARVDTVDREMLALMKNAGCHLIKFGAESGNQDVLNAIKKGITLEQTRAAFAACHEIGIDTHAHMMIGSPGETYNSMEDSLNLVLDVDPTTVTFGICTPYPGTPLFRDVVKKDPSIGDGAENAAMERLHLEGEFNHLYCEVKQSDLRKTLKRFYRRFYLRPVYLARMIYRIRNFNMLRNAVLGGLNVFVFSTQEGQG
jgi:anaerobic magnesium-protoporphyrin IX monomethyl ester cyclase